MARHGIFSGHLGQAHATNRTPHVAVTVYIAMIFALPAFLMIFTNPLTAFGDAGTLAAFGFLVAYYLITVAAPGVPQEAGRAELAQRGPRPAGRPLPHGADHRQLLSAAAVAGQRSSPTSSWGGWPSGRNWLFVQNRRRPGILADIEADLERTSDPIDEEPVEVTAPVTQPAVA